VLAHLDEQGPAFETGLQPAERYFRHSELEPQEIEEEPVVDGVEGCRQVEADQDCLSSAAVKTPSRTSSSAVSVECPFLYADWNWLKLAELSRWGPQACQHESPRTLDTVGRLEIGLNSPLAVNCRARPSSAVEAPARSCIGQETFQSAVTGWRVWQWLV